MSGEGRSDGEIVFTVVPDSPMPPVRAGATETAIVESGVAPPEHDCWENPVRYESGGPLGHGWECGICGAFLQAG